MRDEGIETFISKIKGSSVVPNINIISSSFADELIGKLVTEFGFYGFNNIFKLKNMNANVQSIVQRSVAQRMMESFNGNAGEKSDDTPSDEK